MQVTIPNEQKAICINALKSLQSTLETYHDGNSEKIGSTIYDIQGLIGILDDRYKLSLGISEDDCKTFVSRHNVDFPTFIDDREDDSIVINIPCHEYDRRIFLTCNPNGLITGINFHYGSHEMDADLTERFTAPCVHITALFKRLVSNRGISPYYLDNVDREEVMETIHEAITLFTDAFIIGTIK